MVSGQENGANPVPNRRGDIQDYSSPVLSPGPELAVEGAVADGLDQVPRPDVRAALQVGDGPGHVRDAVMRPRRQPQLVHRLLEQPLCAQERGYFRAAQLRNCNCTEIAPEGGIIVAAVRPARYIVGCLSERKTVNSLPDSLLSWFVPLPIFPLAPGCVRVLVRHLAVFLND